MARSDLDVHFLKIDHLISEINSLVPSDAAYRIVKFRADLSGLLVVAMAATYETCVKETLYEFADSHHAAFGGFTRRNFDRISSRVSIADLKKYCETFDPQISTRFKERLSTKRKALMDRTGKNIERSYEQILAWRHEYAHAGNPSTTIEEAAKTHVLAKRVIYLFNDAFNTP